MLFAGYLHGDAGKLAEGHQKLPADKKFEPFNVSLPSIVRRQVLI